MKREELKKQRELERKQFEYNHKMVGEIWKILCKYASQEYLVGDTNYKVSTTVKWRFPSECAEEIWEWVKSNPTPTPDELGGKE